MAKKFKTKQAPVHRSAGLSSQTASKLAISESVATTTTIAPQDNDQVRQLEEQLQAVMEELEGIKCDLQAAAARENEQYFMEQTEAIGAKQALIETREKEITAKLEKERATLEKMSENVIAKANKEAESIKLKAEQQVSKLKEDTIKEKESILQKAEDEKLKIIMGSYSELTQQKQELTKLHQEDYKKLSEQQQDVDRERIRLEKDKQELSRQNQRLLLLQEDFDADRRMLEESKKSLKEKERLLSPAEVERLKLELSFSSDRLKEQQKMNKQLSEEVTKLRDAARMLGGRTAETVFEELTGLRARVQELEDEHANLPSSDEAMRLRESARELSSLRAKNLDLQTEIVRMRSLMGNQSVNLAEMSSIKAQKEAMDIINRQLREEINLNTDLMKSNIQQAYPSLSQMDLEPDNNLRVEARHKYPINLKDLISQTRTIMAQQEPKPRFYEPEMIQAFLASMASSRIIILQGLSGTGKTSLPRFFAQAIGGNETVIPVQSNWRDRNDLFGYYNDFTKKYTERSFLQALYMAGMPRYRNRPFFIVLDEFNISQVEYYFADILSEMERDNNPDNWRVELMAHNPMTESGPMLLREGRILPIPKNVWFICTANRDESTFPISDKVYDRAQILQFDGANIPFKPERALQPLDIDVGALQQTFEEVAKKGLSTQSAAFVDQFGKELNQSFQVAFGNRFLEQAANYVPVFMAGGAASEGVAIDWLLARKVLRKIEYRPNRIDQLKKLSDTLVQLWTWKEQPFQSKLVIDNEIRRLGGSL